MLLHTDTFRGDPLYHLLTQTVVPRPIAWALTRYGADAEQPYNLAPFSFFNAVSATPPMLMLAVTHKSDGSVKDTFQNLQERQTCTIHIPSVSQAVDVVETARELTFGESELSLLPAAKLVHEEGIPDAFPPRLADCAIAFYCTFHEAVHFPGNVSSVVFCEIKHIYISEQVAGTDSKGRLLVDAQKLDPLARLGRSEYTGLGRIFEQHRK